LTNKRKEAAFSKEIAAKHRTNHYKKFNPKGTQVQNLIEIDPLKKANLED
jgi:hypothetical protein